MGPTQWQTPGCWSVQKEACGQGLRQGNLLRGPKTHLQRTLIFSEGLRPSQKQTNTVLHIDNQRKLNPQSCLTLMCSRDLDPQSLQSPFLIQKLQCQNYLLTIPSSLSSLTDEPVYRGLSVLSFLLSFFLLRQDSIMQPRLTLNSVLSCDSLKMLQSITTPSLQSHLQRAHDTIYWMLTQILKKGVVALLSRH